jgi:hypothetical protein
MVDPKEKLLVLLDSIFEDGIVEVGERQALAALSATIDQDTVARAFRKFVHDKWGEAIADDVVTGPERLLLARIVAELNLSAEDVPVQARLALGDV